MSKPVIIGFRGSLEYRHRVKSAALKRNMPVQDMIEEALEPYLSDGPDDLSRGRLSKAEWKLINGMRETFRETVRDLINHLVRNPSSYRND